MPQLPWRFLGQVQGDIKQVAQSPPQLSGVLNLQWLHDNPEYRETTLEDLEKALKGKFVSCNVQYRDEKTDALVCNVFVQKPPEGF